jgi:hypothetical protein
VLVLSGFQLRERAFKQPPLHPEFSHVGTPVASIAKDSKVKIQLSIFILECRGEGQSGSVEGERKLVEREWEGGDGMEGREGNCVISVDGHGYGRNKEQDILLILSNH